MVSYYKGLPPARRRQLFVTRDDSVALMPLIQINRPLFSDGGDTAGRSGHDRDDGGVPSQTIGLFTTVFVLAVEFTQDDTMSGEDQGTVRKQINPCDSG